LVSCQYRHYGSLLSSRTSFHSYSTFLIKLSKFFDFFEKNLKNVLQSSLRPQEREGQRSHSLRAGGQSSWQPLSIFKIHKYSLFHLSHRNFGFIMIKMAPPHPMLECQLRWQRLQINDHTKITYVYK
jgi:hypothetical protein